MSTGDDEIIKVTLAEDQSCYLDKDGNKYPRVSHIIETFFGGAKDPKQLLTNMKPENKKRSYGEMDDETILKQWEDNKNLACKLGTLMHDSIEQFLLTKEKPLETTDDFDRFIEYFWEPLVTSPQSGDGLTFYAAEQRLTYKFSDMFVNPKGGYVLCDWKRSKGIRPGDTFPPLNKKAPSTQFKWHDNAWFHYSLQLNIYKRMWENAYPEKKVVQLLLVCMHANHPGDRVMEVPVMKNETLDYVFSEVERHFTRGEH